MPITFIKKISPSVAVAVWQIAETEDFFLNSLRLFPKDKATICDIKLQKVRLQKWACRAALSKLLETNEIGITYTKTGQPLLKNYYISFSHTENAVAVALANIPVGIDIEDIKPRILRLYPRFMSLSEIAACDVHLLTDLYYFWCAKEAMFKWYAKKNIDFIEDMQVNKDKNMGMVCNKYIVQLTPIFLNDKILVTCM
jgi:phosphopantetheinyl transferase